MKTTKKITAEVLLLYGSKTEPLIRDSQEPLKEVLPNSKLIELEGLDQGAAQDYGKPEPIVNEIKKFFS